MAWLFVPGAERLNSDCILSCVSNTAAYVLSKGKPTLRPASWHGWKKRPWARRLSGMTLPHSILARGLDSWISSLWACRASPTQRLAANLENVIPALSGPMHGGISALLAPAGFLEKTSTASLPAALNTSKPTWNQTVIALRQESLQRRKLARRIYENAFSSWENWPTPAAAQSVQGQNDPDGRRGQTLVGAARGQNWATPITLQNGPDYARAQRRRGGDDLVTMVIKEARGQNFATPTAHDCKGKGRNGQLVTDLIHGRGQPGAELISSLGKRPGLLNPDWEEHLMGWVSGQSAFTCSEKALSLYLRRWRLWLFGEN